ncbi:transcriptional regulator with XRE-family HTH domain [Roseimicrobium gellanilyticum]|uniref:Transcriptional regulator with XRE-family HTH domain n=1 Tax=Roseimicrobium gellanilyticum TaxID=748857 RepID=A0A366HB93_9BACT|nr:helix-turn-helix transcriptional regulator [Roseimicrobium gellanilyticum]RBP39632.1 transcriptional regulator with XRE-family HTH domain [Roseimicrobium gellanilyticum]
MQVGPRIRSLRLEKGFTLPQLAEEAKVSVGMLSQLENADENSANPNLQTLRKIAGALNVTVGDLLGKAIAKTRTFIPEKLDRGLSEFLERARKRGEDLDEGVLQGCYGMQERDGAPKTADDWEFLYKTIKMTFDTRRRQ